MGYSTASTDWPFVSVPGGVKDLIDTFFSLLDDDSTEVGDRLADEIFAADGVMEGHSRAEGTAAIRKSREHAWKVIKSRHHEVSKVYVSSSKGDDLLLIGKVVAGLWNGAAVTGEFTARIVVGDADTSKPKLELYKVWMDSAPMTKAAQKS